MRDDNFRISEEETSLEEEYRRVSENADNFERKMKEKYGEYSEEIKDNSVENLETMIFGGGKERVSIEEIKKSKDLAKQKIEEITKDYKPRDFIRLDVEKGRERDDILNHETIKTNLIDRIQYAILSLDRVSQERYVERLVNSYASSRNINLVDKVIENTEKRLGLSENNLRIIEQEVAKDEMIVSEQKKAFNKKFAECNLYREKKIEDGKRYQSELDQLNKDAEIAYSNPEYHKWLEKLENDKVECETGMNAAYSKVKYANKLMKAYDIAKDKIAMQERAVGKMHQYVMDEMTKIEVIRTFLDIVKKQYGILGKLFDIEDKGSLDVRDVINKTTGITNTLSEATEHVTSYISRSTESEDLGMEKIFPGYNSKRKYDSNSQRLDFDQVKEEGDRIVATKIKRDYNRTTK
jgi:hypothetical protein